MNLSEGIEATSPFIAPPPPPPDTRSVTPTQTNPNQAQSTNGNEQREVAQRSRWQAVLLEAGGLSAALSEDSMRRLKYCLQWLQVILASLILGFPALMISFKYATAHIDAQILILRDFIASLQPLPSVSLSANRRPPISEEHMRRLTDVRRDIVLTIRQVVDVVSKYAGGALPEPARNRVRGFILNLPQRWASKAGPTAVNIGAGSSSTGERERSTAAGIGRTVAAAATGTGASARRGQQRRAAQRERGAGAEGGFRSSPNSRATSPSTSSPRMSRAILNGDGEREKANSVTEGSAMVAAQRILVLATESLDMMRNVTGVVKDSLDRADAYAIPSNPCFHAKFFLSRWVGRLRTVGIQRGAQEGEDSEEIDRNGSEAPSAEVDFPERHCHHRRTISTQSSAVSTVDDGDVPTSPFLSGSSSTQWASSIPSTPTRSYSSGSFASLQVQNPANRNGETVGENEILPVGLYRMTLSGGVDTNGMRSSEKVEERGEVKVVGVDMDDEEGKMDVDV